MRNNLDFILFYVNALFAKSHYTQYIKKPNKILCIVQYSGKYSGRPIKPISTTYVIPKNNYENFIRSENYYYNNNNFITAKVINDPLNETQSIHIILFASACYYTSIST